MCNAHLSLSPSSCLSLCGGKAFCFTCFYFGIVSVLIPQNVGFDAIMTRNRKCPVCHPSHSYIRAAIIDLNSPARSIHSLWPPLLVDQKEKKNHSLCVLFQKGGNLTLFSLLCKSLKLDLMLCSVLLRNFLSK